MDPKIIVIIMNLISKQQFCTHLYLLAKPNQEVMVEWWQQHMIHGMQYVMTKLFQNREDVGQSR